MASKRSERTRLKVVAHLRNHKLVKGYTDSLPVSDLEALLTQSPIPVPRKIQVQTVGGTRKATTVPLESLKALFFVKSFEGRTDYKEIKFFETHPPIRGLWVRLKFFDNEFCEGVVRNSLDFLADPGFFLKPPDPQGNNEIAYVLKASLTDFQVLGVTSKF